MARVRVYGLKSCDGCRAAMRSLRAAGHSVEFVDVRERSLTREERMGIASALGDRAINRRSRTWRELSDEERALPPEELIASRPTVMKRPVVESGGKFRIGADGV